MNVPWRAIWVRLFGRADLAGLDMGFWVALGVIAVLVVAMNAIAWRVKPRKRG